MALAAVASIHRIHCPSLDGPINLTKDYIPCDYIIKLMLHVVLRLDNTVDSERIFSAILRRQHAEYWVVELVKTLRFCHLPEQLFSIYALSKKRNHDPEKFH